MVHIKDGSHIAGTLLLCLFSTWWRGRVLVSVNIRRLFISAPFRGYKKICIYRCKILKHSMLLQPSQKTSVNDYMIIKKR